LCVCFFGSELFDLIRVVFFLQNLDYPLWVDTNGLYSVDRIYGSSEYNASCDYAAPLSPCDLPVSMAVGLLQVMVMEVVMVAVCFVLVRHLQVVHHHIHMWRQMRPSVIFQQLK